MIDQTPKAIMGVLIVSTIYLWTYSEFIPMPYLLLWIFFQSMFILFRWKNARTLRKHIEEGNTPKIQEHTTYFFISMIISILIWNGAVWAAFLFAPTPYEILTLLIVVGIVTGAIPSLASMYHIYVIYFLLMMLPQFAIMLSYGDTIHLSAASLTLVYMPLILAFTKSIYDNQRENISIHDSLQSNIDKLYTLSITDSLTHTYNRRYFFETAQNIISISKCNNQLLSLVMIDIDHFKNVNDSHGHLAGDIILINLVKEIKSLIRESDVLARMGGEEFAILLHMTSLENANVIAEKIRQVIEEKVFTYQETVIPITVSLGTATLVNKENDIESLYKEADDNLYKAKETGRNKVN
jgi:diguanylate cyclase (GGDEF)-like protein